MPCYKWCLIMCLCFDWLVCRKPFRKRCKCCINNTLFLSCFACFQHGMTAQKWMIDLWGGCRMEINYHIFLSLTLSMMRTRKGLSLKTCMCQQNDYNASFETWDDLPHHRTSSILIKTITNYLICLYGSQIPASQNNSEGNCRWV